MLPRGQIIRNEYRVQHDVDTGATVHQLTADASTNHSLFFLNPSFRPPSPKGSTQVAFVTARGGGPQICLFDLTARSARVLTDVEGLMPFSPAFGPNGNHLYYTTGDGRVGRVDVESGRQETVANTGGGQLGECGISGNGRFIVTASRGETAFSLIVVDVATGSAETIHETEMQMIHAQFHPCDDNFIEYAGHPMPRMWAIDRDGSNNRCLYENQWHEFIVHESFLGASDEMIFAVWPYRLAARNVRDGTMRTIADINTWHMASNREGSLIVSDTNHPDRGLLLIDPRTGMHATLCHPEASSHGSQWKHDHPATPDAWTSKPDEETDARVLSWMEMKVDTVYGPQWTHPHPAFDDDGHRVIYTSDASGDAQVFVVEIDHALLLSLDEQ